MGLDFVFCAEGMQARPHPLVLAFGIAVHRTYIDSRLSKSSQKSWPAPPTFALLLSALYRGHFWASVHVGVRFKVQVHHRSDGPGLLGSCYLKSGLVDQVLSRGLPNKAVDVIAYKLSGDRLIFASSTHGSLDPVPRLARLFPSTQPVVRSPSRRRSPAAPVNPPD